MPPQVCGVCEHPERSAIDKALKDGDSMRSIESRWGISKSAVSRHFLAHVHIDPKDMPSRRDVIKAIGTDAATKRVSSRVRKQLTLDVNMMRDEIIACLKDLREMRQSLTKNNVIEKLPTISTIIKAVEMVLRNAQALGIDLSFDVKKDVVLQDDVDRFLGVILHAIEHFPGAVEAVNIAVRREVVQ